MSTAFFEHQEAARKRTSLLVVLFALGVGLMAVAIYAVAMGAYWWILLKSDHGGALPLWEPRVFFVVLAFLLATVGIGSGMKIWSLSSGGAAVAEALGGRPVSPESPDPAERRLRNIVEEMAIASGTPMPQVFVLPDEHGINAFAAGFTPADAAVAVTRGALDTLSRDELQGVIAHEFSHIFNGDMRLNVRLMGLLHGILAIGSTGVAVLRALGRGGRSRSSSRGKGGGGILIVALVALALIAIGYIGVFFGRLIKAAVSRQREFLADASAVQFTRNPSGLAGALRKIGGWADGSRIESRAAEDASHLFFGNALDRLWFASLLSTHPPLPERILRLDPSFDGTFPQVHSALPAQAPEPLEALRSSVAAITSGPAAHSAPASAPSSRAIAPATVLASAGRITPEQIQRGASLLASLPPELRRASGELLGAVALLYALVLRASPQPPDAALARLALLTHPGILVETRRLLPLVAGLDPRLRLPLIELLTPTLRLLSPTQTAQLQTELTGLIEADGTLSVFEFVLQRTLLNRAAAHSARTTGTHFVAWSAVVDDAAVLLSALVYLGHTRADVGSDAFQQALSRLPGNVRSRLHLLPASDCTFSRLSASLDRLGRAAPIIRGHVLDAACHAVLADREVTVDEGELLRGVADALGAPLPQFLPS